MTPPHCFSFSVASVQRPRGPRRFHPRSPSPKVISPGKCVHPPASSEGAGWELEEGDGRPEKGRSGRTGVDPASGADVQRKGEGTSAGQSASRRSRRAPGDRPRGAAEALLPPTLRGARAPLPAALGCAEDCVSVASAPLVQAFPGQNARMRARLGVTRCRLYVSHLLKHFSPLCFPWTSEENRN